MLKYGDQDDQHLQDELDKQRQQRPDGEKTAAEDDLEQQREQLRKGRLQDE